MRRVVRVEKHTRSVKNSSSVSSARGLRAGALELAMAGAILQQTMPCLFFSLPRARGGRGGQAPRAEKR